MTDTTREEKETDSLVCCTPTALTLKVHLKTTFVKAKVFAHGQTEIDTKVTGPRTLDLALDVSCSRAKCMRETGKQTSHWVRSKSSASKPAQSAHLI